MTRKNFLRSTMASLASAAIASPAAPVSDIYPVPPLARKNDRKRTLDAVQNEKIFRFLLSHGVTRIVYGGNALIYQMTDAQYAEMAEWLSSLTGKAAITPAVGSSFGRALDQAALLRRHRFASVLVLPSGDPRDAAGLEAGLREIAEVSGAPLSLYVKDEANFGADKDAGLDVIARLVDSKICVSVKYAVVRKNPAEDAYLRALLKRIDPTRVISGIGERPAVVHLRDFKLAGFTTGSGVLAPRLCRDLLNACARGDYTRAEEIRAAFLPIEDLRDQWGPPRVLHYAVTASGLADTGPILPYLSPLTPEQMHQLTPVARQLLERNV